MVKSNFFQLSLASKFIIVVVTIPLVMAISISWFAAIKVVESENKPNEIKAQYVSELLKNRITTGIEEGIKNIKLITNTQSLKNYLLNYTPETEEILRAEMNTIVQSYEIYDLIYFCDFRGNLLLSNNVDREGQIILSNEIKGKELNAAEYFVYTKNNVNDVYCSNFNTDYLVSKIYNNNGLGFTIAKAIYDNQKFYGTIVYRISWKNFVQKIRSEEQITMNKKTTDAQIFITKNTNEIIDCSDLSFIQNALLSETNLENEILLKTETREIDLSKYVYGFATEENQIKIYPKWNYITLIPKSKVTLKTFIESELTILLVIIGIVLFFSIIVSFTFSKIILKRIDYIKEVIADLGVGKLNKTKAIKGKDEIAEISRTVNSLVDSWENMVHFAEKIGQSDFSTTYTPLSKDDVVGNSLLKMQKNLQFTNEENIQYRKVEERRSWANKGFGKMNDITRHSRKELDALCFEIICELVTYLNAAQGGFFVKSEYEDLQILKLIACYAYDRRKYMEREVGIGEGIVGSVAVEKKLVYMTDLPQDYIKLTSGLGEAKPRCLVISPLKVEDDVLGVIEIASLHEFTEFELDFIEKISENIAYMLVNKNMNEKTQNLLTQAVEQAEWRKSQEEELRQNMEELTATQEEMAKRENEVRSKFNALESIMPIMETNIDGLIIRVNRNFCILTGYSEEELIHKDRNTLFLKKIPSYDFTHPKMQVMMAGKNIEMESTITHKNTSQLFTILNIALVFDTENRPIKFLHTVTDITLQRQLLAEAKNKTQQSTQIESELKSKIIELETINNRFMQT